MSVTENRSTSQLTALKQASFRLARTYRIVTVLIGWIPLAIGIKLRNLIYHLFFSQIGTSVQIEPNVNFTRTYLIKLGNGVYIRSNANIEACTESSRLIIGERAIIERGADLRVHEGGQIEIGDRTHIGPYTCLSGRSIKIGQDCLIASHVGIYANNHIFAEPNRRINQQGRNYQGIIIEDDCWLGTGVKVLDGVIIGQGSVIGAGAVVTKNIPAYSVAVGTPARVIAQRSDQEK